MNEYEDQRIKDNFEFSPESETLTVVSSGETCPVFFDWSFKPGPRDQAGAQQQQRQAHITAYIGFKDLFIDQRGQKVTIGSKTYTIAHAELLESMGAVSVWLV
jgi:hypothetical protein